MKTISNRFLVQVSFLILALTLGILLTQALHPSPAWAEAGGQSVVDTQRKAAASEFAIAYIGPSRNNQQIRLINPDGSNDRSLWEAPANTSRQNGIGELSWRSDATELAFDSGHDWQRSMHLRDLYAIRPDGAGLRRLTRPPAASGAGAYPTGTVTFWFDSYASGDVQLYLEGADKPISFFTKVGYSYQITQTLPDLGENVRQYIRLYDPNSLTPNWCNYNEEAWVDVVAGQVTDAGRIRFGVADDYTCPQTLRPAWLYNRNELLYLFAEASVTTFQEENNIWRLPGDASPTTFGTRVLDYSQYVTEGRLYLAMPGRTPATANQFLAVVRQTPWSPTIFRAPIDDAGQREIINWGSCKIVCDITGLAWLPDDSGFVFSLYGDDYDAAGNLEKVGAIYRYTFADGQLTELYRISNQAIGRLDISPDGSQIVYEQSNQLDGTTENYWLAPLLLCPCQLWIINSDARMHISWSMMAARRSGVLLCYRRRRRLWIRVKVSLRFICPWCCGKPVSVAVTTFVLVSVTFLWRWKPPLGAGKVF